MSVGNDWNSQPTHQYATGDRSSIDVVAICRHRKWTIVFFTAIATGLGYLYFTKAEPIYETSAQVLIIKRRGESNSPISLLQGELGYEDSMTTHAQVIKSPEIVREAVADPDFNLPALKSFEGIPRESIPSVIIQDLVTGRAGGREAPDSQVLQVNYRSKIPLDAQMVVKAVLKSYADFLSKTYQDINNETIEVITQAKDELKKKLEAENVSIEKYEKSVPPEVTIFFKDGLTKPELELKQAYDDLKKIEADKLSVASLLATIESAQAQGTSAEVLLQLVEKNSSWKDTRFTRDNATTQNEMFPLLLAHQEAAAKYGPKHPKVLEIEMKIKAISDHMETLQASSAEANLQAQMQPDVLLNKNVATLRLELENADMRKQGMSDAIEALKKETESLRGYASGLRKLYDDHEKTKDLFDAVVQKFDQINLVRNRGGFDTKTIWPADDVWQVEPKLFKCLAVGGLAGFLVGLAIAVLVDMADKSFRNAEQVRQELGAPLLGHIPVIPELKRKRGRLPQEGISESVMAFHKPRSTIAEAYRAVRTGLNFGIRGEGHRVIQITSPDPGDGKSTFTANLAVSLAQTGKRVLLADADFRRPRVAKIFGVDPSVGLCGAIQGLADVQDAITPSGCQNLWLLPSGPRPENPSELLGSQRFRDMIDTLREAYDYVLIDTPPVLAVTDPCVVAPRVDGVVLLIRITKDVRPHARRTVESLHELGANIVGVVVNGVGGVRPGTGHVFGSQYGHRYAYESGYYDSNAYDYGAYHHYYTDEEEAEAGRAERASRG